MQIKIMFCGFIQVNTLIKENDNPIGLTFRNLELHFTIGESKKNNLKRLMASFKTQFRNIKYFIHKKA